MSYAVINLKKFGASSASGLQKHNQREAKNHSNQQIDKSKSHLNYDLVNNEPISYTKRWKEHKENYFTEGNRFRKNTIVMVEGIITSDSEFFKNMSALEIKKFFNDNLKFMEQTYGKNNIMYANVHMDETTPHMHIGFTPITKDGRFSAKEIIGNRLDLRKLQDRYHEHLQANGYNLLRGVKVEETQAKHQTVQEYKKTQINKDLQQIKELQKQIEDKEKLIQEYKSKVENMTEKYDEIVKTLHKNSFDLSQIDRIEVQEIKGIFSTDHEHVKIKKSDYNRLKISAKKAYEQHNLHATVKEKIERLEKNNDSLRNEKDRYYRYWNGAQRDHSNEVHYLKKNIDSDQMEIALRNDFIRRCGLKDSFEQYKKDINKARKKQLAKANERDYGLSR